MSDQEILDEIIDDLKIRRASTADFDERMKITDRLLKALNMRAKSKAKKGRGFNLEGPNGQPSSRN